MKISTNINIECECELYFIKIYRITPFSANNSKLYSIYIKDQHKNKIRLVVVKKLAKFLEENKYYVIKYNVIGFIKDVVYKIDNDLSIYKIEQENWKLYKI